MTLRKRRQPTPGFSMPPPYNPLTGERASVIPRGVNPYVALMQVAAEDTHDNYVICRGFDTRDNRFYYYEEGDDDKRGIAVAKPYGKRGDNEYEVGQVFAAVLPLTLLGQNPGVAETTVGHPADLDEEIALLYTDEGIGINWMLLDEGGGSQVKQFCIFAAQSAFTTATEHVDGTFIQQFGSGSDHSGAAATFWNIETHTAGTYIFEGDSGDRGVAAYSGADDDWYIIQFECP